MQVEEKGYLRKFFENLDWYLIAALFYLLGIGLIAVYSATLHYGNPAKYLFTQGMAVFIGLAGMIIFSSFNYQYFKSLLVSSYVVSLGLLVSVLVVGRSIRGTGRWINFHFFAFQPIEVTKIIFIIVLAGYLDNVWKEVKRVSTLGLALMLLFGHIILILLQPDFGSSLVYFPITIVLLFVAGVSPVYLLGISLFGGLAAGIPLMATFFKLQPDLLSVSPALAYFVSASRGGMHLLIILFIVTAAIFLLWWLLIKLKFEIPFIYPLALSLIIIFGSFSSLGVQKTMKEYQRKRLIVFINPEVDSLGSGYNIIQSKITIGSGMMFGKGLFSGTQAQLGFLPEQHTDFIFPVIAEETGFVFTELTIIAYFLLIWRAMEVARESRDRYGSLLATGIAAMFAFYAFINIGMVMGITPATGLPLPLISYGGSSMVSSLWALGILFSIHIRRFTHT
jgi:rod shape determining protein RodA